jgi:hypothetical protein
MRPLPLFIPLCMVLLLPAGFASAQDPQDAEGGKDTPYFTRMPNFLIDETTNREYDSYTFFDGKMEVMIEGKVYQTRHRQKDDPPPVSMLQIRRNYLNAMKSVHAQALFEGQHDSFEDPRAGSEIVTGLWGLYRRSAV